MALTGRNLAERVEKQLNAFNKEMKRDGISPDTDFDGIIAWQDGQINPDNITGHTELHFYTRDPASARSDFHSSILVPVIQRVTNNLRDGFIDNQAPILLPPETDPNDVLKVASLALPLIQRMFDGDDGLPTRPEQLLITPFKRVQVTQQ